MTEEPATISAVTSALQSNGKLHTDNVCRDLTALSARLAEIPASAALVDIDSQTSRVMSSLDPIVRRFPETRFIVLSSIMESRLMLEAMQAGARHFMMKQDVPQGLHDVLRRLCQVAAPSTGQVVSVFSASGGCGATMVAVNLAWEMQAVAGKPAMIVDLDYAYGAVSAYLGVEAPYGVIDLQDRVGPLDPELISTTWVPYQDKINVLLSASSARLDGGGSYARLADTVAACALACPLVVVDAPRMHYPVAAELARASAVNLLVMQLTVKDVKSARHFLNSMRALGLPIEQFTLLINRYRRRGSLELEEARRALGGVKIECLSNDFTSIGESINLGQPLAQVAPRSPVRKELQQLARDLTVQGRMNGVSA
jgi:pilus assembly protein CpaE